MKVRFPRGSAILGNSMSLQESIFIEGAYGRGTARNRIARQTPTAGAQIAWRTLAATSATSSSRISGKHGKVRTSPQEASVTGSAHTEDAVPRAHSWRSSGMGQ